MVKTAMTGATKSSSASTAENDDSNTTTPQPLLQPSEYNQNSSSLQLTVHKLNGKNYLEWAQCVKLVIDGKGKLGHLTSEQNQLLEILLFRPGDLQIQWLLRG